jgi:hypothetical protein
MSRHYYIFYNSGGVLLKGFNYTCTSLTRVECGGFLTDNFACVAIEMMNSFFC